MIHYQNFKAVKNLKMIMDRLLLLKILHPMKMLNRKIFVYLKYLTIFVRLILLIKLEDAPEAKVHWNTLREVIEKKY